LDRPVKKNIKHVAKPGDKMGPNKPKKHKIEEKKKPPLSPLAAKKFKG